MTVNPVPKDMDSGSPAQPEGFLPFPESARVEVPRDMSDALLKAAETLPRYDNKDFYSTALQLDVLGRVRAACPEHFDWVVGSIRSALARRPYCALVGGLRFDEGNRLFVAINRAFGELVAPPYKEPRAQLVHYIEPGTDIASARGGFESERLHTDAADWETPVEFVSMLCVRADSGGGGRSRLLDVDAVREEITARLGPDVLDLLQTQPVPWQLAAYRGGGVSWRTVLTDQSICWRRYTIDLAVRLSQARISPRMLGLLGLLEETISTASSTIDFLMAEGELLFSDNRKAIHSRTPIAGAASDRLMIRSWIRAT